jgi:hypothetical protein
MAPETLGAPHNAHRGSCTVVRLPLLGRLFILVPSYGGGSPTLRCTISTGIASGLYEQTELRCHRLLRHVGRVPSSTGINMSNSEQRSRRQIKQQSEEWPEKMCVSLAHKFLGVSHAKLTSLIKTGVISYEKDPLDHRIKLVRKSDLEQLRRESSSR